MSEIIAFFNSLFSWAYNLFEVLVGWIVAVIGQLGYAGIVAMMFLESSFFPFPSEVVMPPAGYLASKGEMSLVPVIICGIAGSLLGALFNYWIAMRWGRKLFDRYGKYLFITHETLDKAEKFFADHGHISTFTARLMPVIRQYVSLPAGLARMPLGKFCLYTGLGSGIWVVILTLLGYVLGNESERIHAMLGKITIVLVVACCGMIAFYIWRHVKKRRCGADK